jgi:hypothetical protein
MRTDDVKTKVALNKNIYNFSIYNTEGKPSFGYTKCEKYDYVNFIVSSFQLNELSILNTNKVATIVLYSDKIAQNNIELNKDNIIGVLAYVIENNHYKVYLYNKNKNNSFEINSELNANTDFITTNDILKISTNVLKEYSSCIYSFNNYDLLIETKLETSNFQKILALYNTQNGLNKEKGAGPNSCGAPCLVSGDGSCMEHEGGYACYPDIGSVLCEADAIITQTHNNNNNNYSGFPQTLSTLYNFRDNYLFGKQKGENIINLYYELSNSLPRSLLTIEFCNDSYNLISNTICPKLQLLLKNPNSNDILIDSNLQNQLIDYLNLVMSRVTDKDEKAKIYKIIDYVNLFSNKSCYYITNYLNE